jgi:hypothetical protein
VWTDPDPQKSVRHVYGNCSIAGVAYSDRVNVAHFLKTQRRSARVLLPEPISATRGLPDRLWQLTIESPKLTRPGRFHPSTGFCHWRAPRERAQSARRAGRLSRLARIVCPRARQGIRAVPPPIARRPVATVCGWRLEFQSPCSRARFYIKARTDERPSAPSIWRATSGRQKTGITSMRPPPRIPWKGTPGPTLVALVQKGGWNAQIVSTAHPKCLDSGSRVSIVGARAAS